MRELSRVIEMFLLFIVFLLLLHERTHLSKLTERQK